tara:strand:+ start:511 stop:633 length:123 start_codon:yes stop_codon:yes gene_type:complete
MNDILPFNKSDNLKPVLINRPSLELDENQLNPDFLTPQQK